MVVNITVVNITVVNITVWIQRCRCQICVSSLSTRSQIQTFVCIIYLQVVSLELMTAAGEIITCSREKNKEIFLSALCGVGALGVLLTITWQCEPAFRLHQKHESYTLDEVNNLLLEAGL